MSEHEHEHEHDRDDVEFQYRRAIARWYPKSWRQQNEAAMIGTLLDVAEHASRPVSVRRQMLSIASHGLAARTAIVLPSDVARVVSGVAIGSGAGLVVAAFLNLSIPFADQPFLGVAVQHPSMDALLVAWLLALLGTFVMPARLLRPAMVGVAIITVLAFAFRALVVAPGYHWFLPDAATTSFLIMNALTGSLGRPRRVVLSVSFVTASTLFGVVEWASRSALDIEWLSLWGGQFELFAAARGSFGVLAQRINGGTLTPKGIEGIAAVALTDVTRLAILPVAVIATGTVALIALAARKQHGRATVLALCLAPWFVALLVFLSLPPTATFLDL